MITASHLPFNRNGFKFFDNKAGFEKKEIADLLDRAAKEAAQGSLEEDPSFPRDRSQAESSAVQNLERSFGADASLVEKVDIGLAELHHHHRVSLSGCLQAQGKAYMNETWILHIWMWII